jgi:hypothetical protein
MFDLDDAVREWRREFRRERAFSTRDLDELEDHLRAAYEVELHLNPGLAPARAFTEACEVLGTPETLSGEFAKVEGKAWRRLLRLGWVAYAVAYFLPVVRYGHTFKDIFIHGDLPGFEAVWLALTGAGGVVGILSALTNAAMLATLWKISDAGRNRTWLLTVLMMSATILNLCWLFIVDTPADLFAGYYTWLASFGVAGAGLALRARSLPEASTSEDAILVP